MHGRKIGEFMRIAVGADHAGVDYKNRIADVLRNTGHDVEDMGTGDEGSVDYPDFAFKVADAVAQGAADRGILICGTGIGMSISANKVKGIRAALCINEDTAKISRRHNDANVLCLGARIQSWDEVSRIVDVWLKSSFDGGRHARRVAKIDRD